ncbi:PAS domain S-box-containing protein [Paraperlucidibaca baekdonensis]|uniref:histidine kinase n=1 Tax=Paraperlucidibaca baekdonensis TaxID=748120 RepID=A0A3E0H8M8_9GAMM|nr:ATP-binding protein [Paraperlucidibaca baekdonensis]REH39984.1 PAS domain S-box-containing protein [Paraperlucidibaca baekdonensis]
MPELLHALSEEELAHALLQQQVALFERALDEIAEHTPEASLSQAAARVAGLKSPVPGLWLVIDSAWSIQHANEQAGKLLGVQSLALLGRPLHEVLPTASALMAQVQHSADAEITVEAEFRGYDGEPVPLLLSIAQERDAQNRRQYVLIGIDLRDYHRNELLKRQAQKFEAMGSLAAGIAHGINTPLQYLGDNLSFIDEACRDLLALLALVQPLASNHSELAQLLRRMDPDFIRENLPAAVQRSHDGVRRVREITNSMRSFTHISEGILAEDLAVLIHEAVTISTHEIRQVADVILDLIPVPMVLCRRDHIVQVLINLLTNAAHAIATRQKTQSARGHIRITLRAVGEVLRLSVADDGCGIPEAMRHRIFDPFFTTKAVGQGTGQGLPISRGLIVDQHKGRLWCESALPQGTAFIIELPLHGA